MSWWRRWRSTGSGAERAERAVSRLLWERRFERACLLALVGLYLLGFHAQQQTSDRVTREARRNTERSVQINATLCVFRRDLEERVAGARRFLLDHPKGVAGISASAIRVSLMGQERTIEALSGLGCR